MKPLLYCLSREALERELSGLGCPVYRAAQLWQWLYVKRVNDFQAMRNLPAELRDTLADTFDLAAGSLTATEQAPDGTVKLLLSMRDGVGIETVLIPAAGRRTLCVSCEAGCLYACAFCASGAGGYIRSLEAGEMIAQVIEAARQWGDAPDHVVFMGMGEPFHNYDELMTAVRILNDSKGLCIGARRITISTCGVVPGIRRLAAEGLQVELSVSLHAPDNALRDQFMPVNKTWPIEQLLAACSEFCKSTKRIITFEYTLISGVNDRPEQARLLASLLKPLRGRVNLIPLSPVDGFEGMAPDANACEEFKAILLRAGVNTTLRRSRGSALQAACGQLRLRKSCSQAAVSADIAEGD